MINPFKSFLTHGPLHRVSSSDSKVRATLQNSIEHSGSEGVDEIRKM